MAALHSALQLLGPSPYSSIPSEETQAKKYLQDLFAKAQLIVGSVPPPPIEDSFTGRPRADTTTSEASGISEISVSSARSEPIEPSHVALQKEWGKPIKIAAKDNPLGIAVYKLSGKDGKGAWFARSSVHEGLSFSRWKHGFEQEFPESLVVQGGPGEGNVRGIGGERRVEDREVSGAGKIQVYHLSAQFPGPTTPRDFVTLLFTSSTALCGSDDQKLPPFRARPRHFMVVSKPCLHPDCPPRDGFVRGQYESVEFIRELPRRAKKSSSTRDLPSQGVSNRGRPDSTAIAEEGTATARRRSKTISFAESRGAEARGEESEAPSDESDDEGNPVEWVMITRSDPGGSVPRFMVERGTPGSIVADASKFVDWACKKEHPATESQSKNPPGVDYEKENLEAPQTNGHLAGLETLAERLATASPEQEPFPAPPGSAAGVQVGLLANVAKAAKASVEAYAPEALADRLRDTQDPQDPQASTVEDVVVPPGENDDDEVSTATSSMSFASAEEGIDDGLSIKSSPSQDSPKRTESLMQSRHDKELAKLNERKKALDEKFAKSREKETKDKEMLTSKEQERLRKAEDKHKREVSKQAEKYKREVAKLEAKRAKETLKEEDKRKKEQDRDEKARLTRERDEARQELNMVKQERDILSDQVGALQKENTSLVTRLGKMSEGKSVLKEVQAEVTSGTRSRSSSLRSKETNRGKEATILGSGQKDEALK